jgi:hypothetical protein
VPRPQQDNRYDGDHCRADENNGHATQFLGVQGAPYEVNGV